MVQPEFVEGFSELTARKATKRVNFPPGFEEMERWITIPYFIHLYYFFVLNVVNVNL